eukprot:3006402-Rhodomonas_salina.1
MFSNVGSHLNSLLNTLGHAHWFGRVSALSHVSYVWSLTDVPTLTSACCWLSLLCTHNVAFSLSSPFHIRCSTRCLAPPARIAVISAADLCNLRVVVKSLACDTSCWICSACPSVLASSFAAESADLPPPGSPLASLCACRCCSLTSASYLSLTSCIGSRSSCRFPLSLILASKVLAMSSLASAFVPPVPCADLFPTWPLIVNCPALHVDHSAYTPSPFA